MRENGVEAIRGDVKALIEVECPESQVAVTALFV